MKPQLRAVLCVASLLAGAATPGCGREPRALVMVDLVAGLELSNVELVLEARQYDVQRSLWVTDLAPGDAGVLHLGLYLPPAAQGDVAIDATATQGQDGGACMVAFGQGTAHDVRGGAVTAPILLQLSPQPPCWPMAPPD